MEKAFKVRRKNAELMKNKRLVYCFKMANVSEKKISKFTTKNGTIMRNKDKLI